MKIKSTILAATLSLTSLSAFSQEAADAAIPVETSFTTVCSVSGTPTMLDFTNSLIGEARSIDFTVTVDCNFANSEVELGILIPSLFNPDGSIVITQQGAPLTGANILFENPVFYPAPGAGKQTINAQFTAHLVNDIETLAPPTRDFNSFAMAEVFLMVPGAEPVGGGEPIQPI